MFPSAIPLRLKLYALFFAMGVLVLLRVRNTIAENAIEKLAKDIEDADHNRAVAIRRAAARAGRVQRADDPRGYRD